MKFHPQLTKNKQTKYVQSVVGGLLYYARVIDRTLPSTLFHLYPVIEIHREYLEKGKASVDLDKKNGPKVKYSHKTRRFRIEQHLEVEQHFFAIRM